ncbi:crossover junction endodeoxyribonuclease RuvC [Candidatus Gottesmanbacteria bacterium RIFCSPHIGHO2_01_FULL_46_14]|uniref:Crossover junction endodeoxyribonuclease RuvC n=2 Tax=Patescibacteria group TaxID=1783273 RepID=A0A1F5ZQI8_9BACT|nr:MAG: Crossover junction endodeoxyribonuclease RuvC [Candidatus Kaiserbacteria bacterium GW2011_GWB1_52_6]OGG14719.1 MAG: crossover junction endodeoxyribonuclease RuvC [Candidatus Gottesmanbacteria bacterium RIFCSPHIGHO2_01_FULL_46_14]
MVIFGVDPGTTRLGWGVIEKNSALAYGCIAPQSKAPAFRLATIYKELQTLLKTYKPDVVAIEELYFAVNAKTVIPVAEARGVVLLSAAQENIPVISYTPLVVKQTITGSGRADKTQVQKMVKILLKLKEIPKPDDTADALAIAMTHAFTKQYV